MLKFCCDASPDVVLKLLDQIFDGEPGSADRSPVGDDDERGTADGDPVEHIDHSGYVGNNRGNLLCGLFDEQLVRSEHLDFDGRRDVRQVEIKVFGADKLLIEKTAK